MGPVLIPLRAVEAVAAERRWPWAEDNRAAIEAHWSGLVDRNPHLFKGRVLIAAERRFESGVYRATYFPTDYASFIAWRDFGFPDRTVSNGFALAALRAADGAFLVGIMGDHTANAGRLYFAAGTPDPSDVTPDGRLDLAGSVLRELQEETGLAPDEVIATARWTAVVDGRRTALMREVRSPLSGDSLARRIRGWLAGQTRPELAGIYLVRGPDDIDPQRMPPFMQAYLGAAFAEGGDMRAAGATQG